METLWKRLSKENRQKIKSSPYKYLATKLQYELKSEVAWSSLKFESIIFLMQNTTGEPTLIENVDKLFDNEIK
jgi:hypothetical protein